MGVFVGEVEGSNHSLQARQNTIGSRGFLIYRFDSSVGRASAFGAGGRGFESRGRTIPKV